MNTYSVLFKIFKIAFKKNTIMSNLKIQKYTNPLPAFVRKSAIFSLCTYSNVAFSNNKSLIK